MRTDRLKTLHSILEETDGRLKAGEAAGAKVWPSGFGALDRALTGGFRSGELVLLGARPGLGKTTFALQVARNLIASDHSVVYFSFEHDNHSLLERLIVMEAAEIAGPSAVRLPAVRQAFNVPQSSDRMMEGTTLRHRGRGRGGSGAAGLRRAAARAPFQRSRNRRRGHEADHRGDP